MTFLSDESGALTVDWVVMAAAVVGLGVATVASVRSGTQALGNDVSTSLTSSGVASLGTLGSVPTIAPSILEMIDETMWATGGGRCPVGPCLPPTEYYEQRFEMSDGQIWTRNYEVVNGAVTVWSWTDADGNTVDGESPCSRSLPCAS